MLTCRNVRERLVEMQTGDRVEPALHDHLASCDACRAEARRLRDDLQRMRDDLASLAPSPFLEDAAVSAARAEVAASSLRRWLAPALAVAAAALVLAILVVARLPEDAPDGLPAGEPADPGGPSRVELPPTPREAVEERRKRFAAAQGQYESWFFGMIGAPPEGMVLLGRRLLERIGPAAIEDGAVRAQAAFDELTAQGRAPDVELLLSAPGADAASARVLARVSMEYSGHLLVEEPLARALGLHAFERPGGVTIGGDLSMGAEQSRAHVTLRAWEGETDCEVLHTAHMLPAVPVAGGMMESTYGLEIRGERPDGAFLGLPLGMEVVNGQVFVVADREVRFEQPANPPLHLDVEAAGPVRAALRYAAGEHPECFVLLPPVDVGGGGMLPTRWAMRLERVTLKTRFEPGAQVTVARVWRGRTAIPSRDSVAHTTADEEGVASIVRVRGERGALIAREVRKDGTVKRYETLVEPEMLARRSKAVILREDGRVTFASKEFPVWAAQGGEVDPQARDSLRDELARWADAVGRDERGLARGLLVLAADGATPWPRMRTLVFLCADAEVRVPSVEFATSAQARGVRYDLPTDTGLAAAAPPTCTVRVFPYQDGFGWSLTTGSMGGGGPLDASPMGTSALQAQLRAARGRLPADTPLRVLLVPGPAGSSDVSVPFEGVRRILGVLREAGVGPVAIKDVPTRVR